jgi:GrpB-like predicted nucleotidyltransferase (UPF0157 family)
VFEALVAKGSMVNYRVIEVVEYDPSWAIKFDIEREILQEALGSNAVNIEHIGSTAVFGLAAKPVIDILVQVSSLKILDANDEKIESLGYAVKGENGIEGRRYFQKGGNKRTHHVHVFQTGDESLIRHRAFKEYLIAYPEITKEYGEIKMQAARNCQNDIALYMSMKNGFIQKHEKLARRWYGT